MTVTNILSELATAIFSFQSLRLVHRHPRATLANH